ncbi:defensin-like protein 1 [Cicer arietinum]|uniref:Defensin-like protein 1 n=1 Tax=Cicer arietinum TaxID=3827 RepID=A0A1S2YTE8_CICAR|nr:defensin-like protein 1 [Cicer arietinum]
MARSIPFISTIFVMFLLLVATEMGPIKVAEARICDSQSNTFKGPCVIDHSCAIVCQTEGFTGGQCEGLRRICFCTKPC